MEETNWGTWEELVLGGAVLRHGRHNWDAVAEELRSRTFYPYFFTPEACKAKYLELQERFSGCTALLDELRKQRVAELKRELEKSEGSIGSLESKLESLKSEKNEDHNSNYAGGPTESPPSVGNISRVDYPPKETSKDGLSAGSYTEETQTDSSPEFQVPVAARAEMKTEEGEHVTSKENILKKRRGKRKRKDITKEVIHENVKDRDDTVRSVEGDRDRAVRSSNDVTESDPMVESGNMDLLNLLDSIIESENLSTVFQRRTDSQRRGKYKKTIKRHVDLGTIRCGISDHSIASEKELYRDLLLLCNNIIVFYSKESREYKSAISLRAFVTKFFRQRLQTTEPVLNKPTQVTKPKPKPKPKPKSTCNPPDKPKPNCNPPEKPNSNPPEKPVYNLFEPPACIPPVKPRSARPGNPKAAKKLATNEESSPVAAESRMDVELPTKPKEEKAVKKKVDRPVKVGRSGGSKRVETPVNGNKRARKR